MERNNINKNLYYHSLMNYIFEVSSDLKIIVHQQIPIFKHPNNLELYLPSKI
jgi:hypothetical protein